MINKDFSEAVSDLKQKFLEMGFSEEPSHKYEFMIESINDWSELSTLDDVNSWFEICREDYGLDVAEIPLDQCRNWEFNNNEISHSSGKFYFVQGIRVLSSKGREIESGWDQPMLTQVGNDGGILGLLRVKINSIPYYLVEAKAEPGNPDIIQISPTLQATFSNIETAHGGRKPFFADLFVDAHENRSENKVIFNQWMSEDGGRLFKKRNKGIVLEVSKIDNYKNLPNNFKLLSLFQIKYLISKNSWISPHVRSLISHF